MDLVRGDTVILQHTTKGTGCGCDLTYSTPVVLYATSDPSDPLFTAMDRIRISTCTQRNLNVIPQANACGTLVRGSDVVTLHVTPESVMVYGDSIQVAPISRIGQRLRIRTGYCIVI